MLKWKATVARVFVGHASEPVAVEGVVVEGVELGSLRDHIIQRAVAEMPSSPVSVLYDYTVQLHSLAEL